MSTDWLVPDWPAPDGIKAVFTTRAGGISNPPWDNLNLGDHVGDAPRNVAANRAALQQAISSRPVFLKQVHGVGVEHISSTSAHGTVADACITTQRGVACTIMVADCLPVLLTNSGGTAVAAAHAGWRGLAGVDGKGVLEAVFSAFQVTTQHDFVLLPPLPGEGGVGASAELNLGIVRAPIPTFPREGKEPDRAEQLLFQVLNRPLAQSIRAQAAPEIIAWLGPCIGPDAFEVGAEVKAVFEASQPDAAQFFKTTSQGKYLADLAGLARARLQSLGITQIYGNDSSAAWCTVGNPSRFFSHRRDAGALASGGNGFNTTGRMAACIWLD